MVILKLCSGKTFSYPGAWAPGKLYLASPLGIVANCMIFTRISLNGIHVEILSSKVIHFLTREEQRTGVVA